MDRPILRTNLQDSTTLNDSGLLSKIALDYSSSFNSYSSGGYGNLGYYDRLYTSSGLINNIVSLLPSDATKHDLNVIVDGNEDKALLDYLDTVRVITRGIDESNYKEAIYQALVMARLYGDAFMVCGYNDTKDLSKPLSKRGSLKLDWVTVRTRNEISIDINKKTYVLQLESNKIKELGIASSSVSIHPSRVVRFKGVELFERALQQNSYFNLSILDLVYREYCRFDSSIDSVAKMVKSHSAFSYGIKDLSVMVKNGNEALIRKRFQSIIDAIENIGGVGYDLNNEKVDYLNRSYSGIDGLIDHFKDCLLSVSGLPAYKLFNRASVGSMSTSASEERLDWVERVAAFQQNHIDAPVVQLIKPLFPAGTRVNVAFQPFYTLGESDEETGDGGNNDDSEKKGDGSNNDDSEKKGDTTYLT